MSIKSLYISLLITFIIMPVYASSPSDTTPTKPTEASQPIPDIKQVKNIDTVLSEKVQAAIKANKLLENQSVSAASTEQVITLQGTVETKEQETEAIATAKKVPGVKNVISQLTIKGKK